MKGVWEEGEMGGGEGELVLIDNAMGNPLDLEAYCLSLKLIEFSF